MLLASLGRLKRNLIYGFRRDLRPYEAAVLESVFAACGPPERGAFEQQFRARERVQRWSDRVLYFSLPPRHGLPPIAIPDPDYCYASVRIGSPEAKVTAKLMTHRGFLSTIEFSRNPMPVLSGSFAVLRVKLHPGGTGYTEEINEAEHGSPGDA